METVIELKAQLKQLADASATQQHSYQQLQDSHKRALQSLLQLQQAVASATTTLYACGQQQPQPLLQIVCSQLGAAGAAARAVLASAGVIMTAMIAASTAGSKDLQCLAMSRLAPMGQRTHACSRCMKLACQIVMKTSSSGSSTAQP
jgi:hypothetical protein